MRTGKRVVWCIVSHVATVTLKNIDETGWPFGVRLHEHRKEAEKSSARSFTKSARRTSEQEQHKSAITDHVVSRNHVMNWEQGKVVTKEELRFQRWVRESIHIK